MNAELDRFRRFFRVLAILGTLASALLTGIFGWHQSPWWPVSIACAVFLVGCSFASDYIWLFLSEAIRSGRKGLASIYAAGGALVLLLNLISNIGSVGWQQDVTMTQAKVQAAVADMAGDQVVEGAGSLAMWEARYKALTEQNGWIASVTATALRAQIPHLDEAIAQEARRVRCGEKCLDLKRQKAVVEERIALSEERADLSKKIEATKTVIAKHREKAAAAESSRTVAAPLSQARFFASLGTGNLDPSAATETWTQRGMASFIAIGLVFFPALCGLVGWVVIPALAARDPGPRPSDAVVLGAGEPDRVTDERGADRYHVVRQMFDDPRLAQAAALAFGDFATGRQLKAA